MDTNDIINASFELGGGLMVIPSILNIMKTKSADGIATSTITFFTLWGIWNVYYYPAMEQPLSATAAVLLTTANLTWWSLIIRYRKKGLLNKGVATA